MTLYALHHDWIDGHAMQGPVGIWNEHGESYYPAITEHLRRRGHRARSRPKDRSWAGHLEYLTYSLSADNANWSVVESEEAMHEVLAELQTKFFAVSHPVKRIVLPDDHADLKEDSEGTEEDPGASEGDSHSSVPEPAERFTIAQTWWTAAEFIRRHPDWAIRYGDHLSYLTLVNPSKNDRRHVVCNPGTVHMFGPNSSHTSVRNLLSAEDPHELIRTLGRFVGDPTPVRTPASTPRSLAYRVIAAVMTMTVNDRAGWKAQNEVLGDDGYGSGPIRGGFVTRFPAAERDAETVQREDWDLGEPWRHFWAILRDDAPVAILSTEGRVYRQDRQFELVSEYQAHGRRILPLVVAVLGDLLP